MEAGLVMGQSNKSLKVDCVIVAEVFSDFLSNPVISVDVNASALKLQCKDFIYEKLLDTAVRWLSR